MSSKTSRDPYEPWLQKSSGWWCKKVGGKLEYLAKDYKAAKHKLSQLVHAAQANSLTRDWLEAPFSNLADEYLEDVKARRAPATYSGYRYQLVRAMKILGVSIRVRELKRIHLAKIEQQMTGKFSPATIRDTIAVVQQVFNWAVRNDLLEKNPLVGYQKPVSLGRSRIMTDDEFQALLDAADLSFQRFLLALRLTGCRPGEVRNLTWDMVDLNDGLWILRKHKTVTMQRTPAPRIIPMPEKLEILCRELAKAAHKPSDHVFVNQHGKPYSKDCVVRKMARLRTKAGIKKKAGENIICYTNRHTYATNAIGRVSDTELAELMGHTSTETLRRYLHLDATRLREIQKRAQG